MMLSSYQEIAAADPQDAQALVRIAESSAGRATTSRRWQRSRRRRRSPPIPTRSVFNEALTDDSLGRYAEATQVLQGLVTRSAKPDNQYTDSEKNNRSIFLDRLANVEREQNHTEAAVDGIQADGPLGGEYAERGYQGEVDAYRDAKQYDKATQVARDAAKAMPGNKSIQLMLAGQLADTGHAEEGIELANAQLKHNADDRDVYLALAQIDTRLRPLEGSRRETSIRPRRFRPWRRRLALRSVPPRRARGAPEALRCRRGAVPQDPGDRSQ